ncbi:MAG: sugar transferase, partial [Candidatus Andersenbacteria bacterium]|nr:sugar transferase [Candidatus Andersenbacteria bacterium]
MKRSELLFTALLVPLDYLMILLAAAAAFGLRFLDIFTEARPVEFETTLWEFLELVAIAAPVALLIFASLGFYQIRRHRNVTDDLIKAFIGMTVAVTVFIVYVFFTRELYESRFLVISVWLLAVTCITLGRFLLRRIRVMFFKRGVGLHRVVILGNGKTGERLSQIYQKASLGHNVVAEYETLSEGVLKKLKQFAKNPGIDEVIVTNTTAFDQELLLQLHQLSEEQKWEFAIVPDLFGTLSNFDVHDVGGIPLFEIRHTPLEGWYRILKRIIDIVGALLFLVLFSPVFLVTAIWVKLDSSGPIFYGSQRVNKTGMFKLWKFRSMVKDADKLKAKLMEQNERTGPLFKIENDPRVTRVGRFIRATRIDELPQLWNVLRGEMSLVGPRPHLPAEVEQYEAHHRRVLGINSGMTGLAQVSGSSDLDFEEEVRL